MKKFLNASLFLAILLSFILSMILLVKPFQGMSIAGSSYEEGHWREMRKNLDGWHYPKVVQSGTTLVVIDLTDGGMQFLDLDPATAGVSIAFTGTAKVPCRTLVVWNGTGDKIQPLTTGYSPIVYTDTTAWPFPDTSSAARTYMLEVISGVPGPGEVTGTTVWAIKSGVTAQP